MLMRLAGEIGLRLIRFAALDSGMVRHARREWEIIFPKGVDEMQDEIGQSIFDVVATFGLAGHSGMSASYTISFVENALSYKAFSPLTGADSEWVEIGDQDGKPLYQNNRCGRVFKCGDQAYDIDGRIFVDPDGASYTNFESHVDVSFPYTPKSEIVRVGHDDMGLWTSCR